MFTNYIKAFEGYKLSAVGFLNFILFARQFQYSYLKPLKMLGNQNFDQ